MTRHPSLGFHYAILLDMDVLCRFQSFYVVNRVFDTKIWVVCERCSWAGMRTMNSKWREEMLGNRQNLREALDETVFMLDDTAFCLCFFLGPT